MRRFVRISAFAQAGFPVSRRERQYATFRQNLRFRASGVSGEPSRTS
jgi:hypothetical protein